METPLNYRASHEMELSEDFSNAMKIVAEMMVVSASFFL